MADEHKHGSMDIKDQEKTFAGFVKFTNYSIVAIIAVLIFLALFNS